MAKKFGDTSGSGTKDKLPQYEYKNGDHKLRLVGDVLPRYIYWVKNPKTGKDMPVECLGFDREQETFTNIETDHVRKMYPDMKCTWAYAILCLDLNGNTPELKVLNLKRKLFEQIKSLAGELGDPTDETEGWDVEFDRKKTGPHAFNVEYTLKQLACSKNMRPLTDEEKEVVENGPVIDDVLPRVTPEKQKEFLDRIHKPDDDAEQMPEGAANEFDGSESPNELPQ